MVQHGSLARRSCVGVRSMASGLVAAAALAAAVNADVVALTHGVNGYVGGRDNSIYDENSSRSNGMGDYIFSGCNSLGDIRRTLVMFDLASAGIPSGAIVTSVTFRLVVNQTNSVDRLVSMHRLTNDWGEGTEDATGAEGQGTTATVGSATWSDNHYQVSQWGTAGGDFLAAVSASATAPASGAVEWSGTGLVADVMAWLNDPSTNFGWILRGQEDIASSSIRYISNNNNEGAPLADRPTLTIEYIVPGPGAGAALLGVGGLVGVRRRRRA